jgi:hypothetical protein
MRTSQASIMINGGLCSNHVTRFNRLLAIIAFLRGECYVVLLAVGLVVCLVIFSILKGLLANCAHKMLGVIEATKSANHVRLFDFLFAVATFMTELRGKAVGTEKLTVFVVELLLMQIRVALVT